MNRLNDFMSNTKGGLTKNPLGIIGLFISLIYGFACLVLSTSISNLSEPTERLPLIWFIIVFPIVILAAFLFLVVNHHEKLYAPGDFRNDDSFIETMNGKRIKEKKEQEVELLVNAEESENETEIIDEFKKEETSLKEKTVKEISVPESKEELVNRYKNVEKWAIKELELEYNIQFRTNQTISMNGIKLELDAYASNPKKAIIAEVKYWESNKAVKPLLLSLQNFVLKFDRFKRAFGSKEVELAIVIVFDELKDANTERIKSFISELNKNINLQFRQYSDLKKDFEE